MLFGTYVIAGVLDAKATCESGLDLDASGDDSDSLEAGGFEVLSRPASGDTSGQIPASSGGQTSSPMKVPNGFRIRVVPI